MLTAGASVAAMQTSETIVGVDAVPVSTGLGGSGLPWAKISLSPSTVPSVVKHSLVLLLLQVSPETGQSPSLLVASAAWAVSRPRERPRS